ncbi:MAG: hypothetical protein DCC71_17530 [Proteobacteria bacterium]|nr:MAG: hypothetical protein DCC71_17530 [Pseudomonadota bacterium]
MHRRTVPACLLVAAALACGGESERTTTAAAPQAPAATPAAPAAAPAAAPKTPDSLPRGLLLALSQFEVSPEGKVLPKPGAAKAEILVREGGAWKVTSFEDPESNVFHKVMVYGAPDGPAILTLGGSKAVLRLWRKGDAGMAPVATLWSKDFGGKFSRMRDAEIADVRNDGRNGLAVATHDQGVVATVLPDPKSGSFEVTEIDAEKDTFVHEIEVGDLDGDGVVEVYATPSEPNKLDGTEQSGHVTRYVPAKGEGSVVVADLGNRHAKEILVRDVDGDGRDELYVAVEAHTEGSGAQARIVEPVEIRRYDAGTEPSARNVVAKIDDRLCRFLTAGDVDGDGKKEMVAAGFKSGLWLLRPGADPKTGWKVEQIDASSSGFEHASLLTDLDGDQVDELYVASDDQGEVRRYVFQDGRWAKEVIHTRKPAGSAFTWNLMPVPVELVK